MLKKEVTHILDNAFVGGISKTVKTISMFGVIVFTKTFNYPDLEDYHVQVNF